ncbi:hypothetical protein Tco_0940313 [Tanacetum coccineum]|uniref:Uncharacterized protein n=1 Tax=Tanacetum coccineum TaxID=301880 RepID=A0ABQ5DNK3_9ASTR
MNKFVLASFSSFIVYRVSYSDEGQMFIEFVIQNQFFSYLEEFALILDVPCEGACVFTDRWRLDELAYGIPSDGPYQTNLPSIEDIISSIRIDRDGQVCRIRHEEEIDVLEYQVLTREIEPTLKPLEEIIWENVFCLGGENSRIGKCVLCLVRSFHDSSGDSTRVNIQEDASWHEIGGSHSLLLPHDFEQPSSSHYQR